MPHPPTLPTGFGHNSTKGAALLHHAAGIASAAAAELSADCIWLRASYYLHYTTPRFTAPHYTRATHPFHPTPYSQPSPPCIESAWWTGREGGIFWIWSAAATSHIVLSEVVSIYLTRGGCCRCGFTGYLTIWWELGLRT